MKKVRSCQAAILVLKWVKHSFSLWVSLSHWSQLDFKKQYLSSVSSVCLCTDDKIPYASLMFCSFYPDVDINETDQIRGRSVTFLKNGRKELGKRLSWSLKTFRRKSSVDCRWLFHKWEWKTSVIMITNCEIGALVDICYQYDLEMLISNNLIKNVL